MAAAFIPHDRNTDLMRPVVRALQLIREGVETLTHARAVILQTRDGDGTQAAHYDLTATLGGFTAGDYADGPAAAKASFDELDSIHFKLTTNASVSDVAAAIAQACAKHGV